MFSKLKQIKDLRSKAKLIQNKLSGVSDTGTASWGKVKVEIDGNQNVLKVEIAPELLKESEKNALETALKDAFNDAVKKIHRKMVDVMKDSGDLSLPGLS